MLEKVSKEKSYLRWFTGADGSIKRLDVIKRYLIKNFAPTLP